MLDTGNYWDLKGLTNNRIPLDRDPKARVCANSNLRQLTNKPNVVETFMNFCSTVKQSCVSTISETLNFK